MDIDFPQYRYRLSCQLGGHLDDVCGICVCGNGGFATSSRDKTIRIWTVTVNEKNHRNYTMSMILSGHTSFVGALAWIPASDEFPEGRIVSGGMDTLILVWDLVNGEILHTLKGHRLEVTGVALDGCDIVSTSVDCTLRRWRKGHQIEVLKAHQAPVQSLVKLPSGELVTGSSDTTLKLWKGKTCIQTFAGHRDTVQGLAFMPELGILSASHDGSIRLWALRGQLLMEMVGHTSTVYSVDSHVSGLIASGSKDRFAKIWKDGACIQSIEHPGCVWDVKFLHNGDVATACSDGILRIWTVHPHKAAERTEIDSYVDQLSQYKTSSRKTVGGLKLEEIPGLEALTTPDHKRDVPGGMNAPPSCTEFIGVHRDTNEGKQFCQDLPHALQCMRERLPNNNKEETDISGAEKLYSSTAVLAVCLENIIALAVDSKLSHVVNGKTMDLKAFKIIEVSDTVVAGVAGNRLLHKRFEKRICDEVSQYFFNNAAGLEDIANYIADLMNQELIDINQVFRGWFNIDPSRQEHNSAIVLTGTQNETRGIYTITWDGNDRAFTANLSPVPIVNVGSGTPWLEEYQRSKVPQNDADNLVKYCVECIAEATEDENSGCGGDIHVRIIRDGVKTPQYAANDLGIYEPA